MGTEYLGGLSEGFGGGEGTIDVPTTERQMWDNLTPAQQERLIALYNETVPTAQPRYDQTLMEEYINTIRESAGFDHPEERARFAQLTKQVREN